MLACINRLIILELPIIHVENYVFYEDRCKRNLDIVICAKLALVCFSRFLTLLFIGHDWSSGIHSEETVTGGRPLAFATLKIPVQDLQIYHTPWIGIRQLSHCDHGFIPDFVRMSQVVLF